MERLEERKGPETELSFTPMTNTPRGSFAHAPYTSKVYQTQGIAS